MFECRYPVDNTSSFAYVHLPCVNSNMRTPATVEQVVTAQSTIHLDGSYVVQTIVDIDGLSFAPSKIGLVREDQRKHR
jgi:hypothetical protein